MLSETAEKYRMCDIWKYVGSVPQIAQLTICKVLSVSLDTHLIHVPSISFFLPISVCLNIYIFLNNNVIPIRISQKYIFLLYLTLFMFD